MLNQVSLTLPVPSDPTAFSTAMDRAWYSAGSALMEDGSELVTLYYGKEISEDEAEGCREALAARYADLEIELQSGGQPVYYYIVSVE